MLISTGCGGERPTSGEAEGANEETPPGQDLEVPPPPVDRPERPEEGTTASLREFPLVDDRPHPNDPPVVGRVVDARGIPVAGAHVRVVAYDLQEHRGPLVLAAEQGDAEGRFRVQRPEQRRYSSHLLVEADGMTARTLSMDGPQPLEVRIARGIPLTLTIRCAELFDHPLPDTGVRVVWTAIGTNEPWPGQEPLEGEAERFVVSLTVPPGRSSVRVTAPCGFDTRDIEALEGAPLAPLEMVLPRADAGALRIRSSIPSDDLNGIIGVWSEDGLALGVGLNQSNDVLVRGLPPGPYRVGIRQDTGRQRSVTVQSRAVTTVDVGFDLVQRLPAGR